MAYPKKHFDTPCLFCGNTAKGPKKYCNNHCQQLYQRSLKIEAWLKGDISGGSHYGVCKPIRQWLLDRANHRCQKCGWCEINPTTGVSPLEVNHIDGNALNHRPENLEIICPNCHSLTSTFRALNKGNGKRSYRCP